ncbi:hypothetical protein ES702_00362 [subsurface metagenome]
MVSYRFLEWQNDNGDTVATTPSITLIVESDVSIIAVYGEFVPSKPCFIATACYGSPLAPQLITLRKFRDRCLPNPLVQLYYITSPPIAEYIRCHSNIRRTTRQLLEPLIKAIKKLL